MANSKETRHKAIHTAICPDCNGNGYKQFTLEEGREHVVLQCETCESEGEIYVFEPKTLEFDFDADPLADDVGKLH